MLWIWKACNKAIKVSVKASCVGLAPIWPREIVAPNRLTTRVLFGLSRLYSLLHSLDIFQGNITSNVFFQITIYFLSFKSYLFYFLEYLVSATKYTEQQP